MAKKKDKVEEAAPATDNRATIAITRAIADPNRYALLKRIANADASTCTDLRTCTGMNPATLSHHMKQLESAGLIETARDGKYVRATLKRKVWKGYLADLKALAG